MSDGRIPELIKGDMDIGEYSDLIGKMVRDVTMGNRTLVDMLNLVGVENELPYPLLSLPSMTAKAATGRPNCSTGTRVKISYQIDTQSHTFRKSSFTTIILDKGQTSDSQCMNFKVGTQ